jgi:hypothetical protein
MATCAACLRCNAIASVGAGWAWPTLARPGCARLAGWPSPGAARPRGPSRTTRPAAQQPEQLPRSAERLPLPPALQSRRWRRAGGAVLSGASARPRAGGACRARAAAPAPEAVRPHGARPPPPPRPHSTSPAHLHAAPVQQVEVAARRQRHRRAVPALRPEAAQLQVPPLPLGGLCVKHEAQPLQGGQLGLLQLPPAPGRALLGGPPGGRGGGGGGAAGGDGGAWPGWLGRGRWCTQQRARRGARCCARTSPARRRRRP